MLRPRGGWKGVWKGDGGESAESQEGEFGAEVSAFLSACMYATYVRYVRLAPWLACLNLNK